jgi:ABC-2 type transport system ATP-binding protein
MIYADHLTKYYGHQPAIQNISFHVNQGEIFGLLGPYGAGKTTLLRILTAYTPPSAGAARVNGYDVFRESLEVRKRLGYLPATVSLYNNMTIAEYLEFVAALRKVNRRVVKQTLEKVNLGSQARLMIGKLDKGLRRRVGLAQAIVHNPAVLILDEPTAGLEPLQIMAMRQLIKELSRDHTIILSTPILAEAQQLCQRVLVMNQGQLVVDPLADLEEVFLTLTAAPEIVQ